MANKKNEINRSEITDKAIHSLAQQFFGYLKPTDKALKIFLSHEQQRSEFLKWVDHLAKEWAED